MRIEDKTYNSWIHDQILDVGLTGPSLFSAARNDFGGVVIRASPDTALGPF
jgi:hypothetical protein